MERQGTVLGLEAARVFHTLETRKITQTRAIHESYGLQVIWTDHVEDRPSVDSLDAVARPVELPLRPLPPPAGAEQELERRERTLNELLAEGRAGVPLNLARQQRDWAARVVAEVRAGRRDRVASVELQAMRFNELVLVAIPAEPFVEIGLAIKSGSKMPLTLPVGYANGCLTYVPWPDAYADGGYEVDETWKRSMTSGPAPECAGIIVDACLELIDRLAVGSAP